MVLLLRLDSPLSTGLFALTSSYILRSTSATRMLFGGRTVCDCKLFDDASLGLDKTVGVVGLGINSPFVLVFTLDPLLEPVDGADTLVLVDGSSDLDLDGCVGVDMVDVISSREFDATEYDISDGNGCIAVRDLLLVSSALNEVSTAGFIVGLAETAAVLVVRKAFEGGVSTALFVVFETLPVSTPESSCFRLFCRRRYAISRTTAVMIRTIPIAVPIAMAMMDVSERPLDESFSGSVVTCTPGAAEN